VKSTYLKKGEVKKELGIWLPETRELEKTDREGAVREYQKIAKAYPLTEHVYDRIMILYRLLKKPAEELRWIEKAIQIFEKHFAKPRSKSRLNAKINSLSKSILRSTGLVDKKGRALHQPQPIGRWQKRKELLQVRMSR
jgi:tetratricopeptide (TPR) repeat protein